MAAQRTCRVVSRNPEVEHKGWIEECFEGTKQYAAFYGIRYAAKPEGDNRSKAPVPLTSEEASRLRQSESAPSSSQEARTSLKKKSSIQNPPNYDVGSTDCLVLNVYTPQDPNQMNERLPVLVFIHGGGFKRGSGEPEYFSPEAIVQFGVVFVTINYRLGAFGFLNLRTPEFPGNVGLKDQVQALEWIRDNIECFKGDPKNVTISGWSAGATSVNAHLISSESQGLFHKAILHSGGLFFPWGYKGHQIEQKKAFKDNEEFSSLIHDEEKSKELYQCADAIVLADRLKFHSEFGVVVEKERKGAFLADKIETAMKDAQPNVPVMAGITKSESLEYFIDSMMKPDVIYNGVVNNHEFEQILMDNLRWSKETAVRNREEIRMAYFPEDPTVQNTVTGYVHLLNDIFIRRFYDCFKFGPDKTLPKKFFVYRFEHVCEMSLVEFYKPTLYELPPEATHGDDVDYLYGSRYIQRAYEQSIAGEEHYTEVLHVMNHMCSLWASFCKTGQPKSEFDSYNIEWKCHSEEMPYYLIISERLGLVEGYSLLDERCEWFRDLVNDQTPIQSEETTPDDD